MTEVEEKKEFQSGVLPIIPNSGIQRLQQNESSSSSSQNGDNLLPETHKKKKRKHKKHIKHSPQYYEQKRLRKLNRLRQRNWNDHFVNAQIPKIFEKEKSKGKKIRIKELSKKRSATASQKQLASKAITTNLKKQMGSISDKKSTTAKSFNIRVVNNKSQQPQKQSSSIKNINKQKKISKRIYESKRQSKPQGLQDNTKQENVQYADPKKPLAKTQKSRPKRGSRMNQELIKYNEQYKKKIQQTFEQTKALFCHRQVLQQFLPHLVNKAIRNMFDKQLQLVKDSKSYINKITQAIVNREKLLVRIKQINLAVKDPPNQSNQKQPKQKFQLIDDYRTSTLIVIQQIIKWKQFWQSTYLQVFGKHKVFDLIYKGENYLLSLIKSTDEVLVKYYKDKQKQNQHQQQEPHELKIQSINNKVQTQNIENNLKIQEKAQKNKSNQKKQPNKNETTSKDPFLISIYSLDKQNNNFILKIRACQLLLLEEQYNNLKK